MSAPAHTLPFRSAGIGTLGVEMEWMTVDDKFGTQIPAAPSVFAVTGDNPRIKPELFTSTVEINTSIHRHVTGCMQELRAHYRQVDAILRNQHAALLASGTHPVSRWRDQEVTPDERYQRLLERLQWMARRFNIFGIHVHVGMPDGDACIRVMNQLLPIMPVFLAISANSPFWQGQDTGLAASRIKIFEGLSQGGMPFYFNDWHDFEHCASRLLATGSIDSVRDIWWEMRPHPDFGTLEVRIGDMPLNLADTAAYIAYVHAEAMFALNVAETLRVHPSLIRENRWRACRHGIEATIIDPHSEALIPLLDWLERRLDILLANGADHDAIELVGRRLTDWRRDGGGAQRQRALYARHQDFRRLVQELRLQDGWQDAENHA